MRAVAPTRLREMTRRERQLWRLFVSALVLGVLGDVLFHGRPLGAERGPLRGRVRTSHSAWILRVGRVPLHQGRRFMAAPLLVFAGLLAWHDSPLLLAANLLAVAGAVTIGALRRTKPNLVTAECRR